MIEIKSILTAIKTRVYKGSYIDAIAFIDSLPFECQSHPAVAIEISRAFLRQGHPIHAGEALVKANLDLATPGERLILAMETAYLRIYRYVAIQDAINAAETLIKETESISINEFEKAEVERVYIRILISAATYHVITPEEGQKAIDRLPILADILERGGCIDEALAAQLTYAERLVDSAARLEELDTFVDRALHCNRLDLAAEAHLTKADLMLATGKSSADIHAQLEVAQTLFTQINHAHGPIDIKRLRARLSIQRELAGPEDLRACLEAYTTTRFYRGVINVLMDLSQLAHDSGDTVTAGLYRQQLIDLSVEIGMGLVRDSCTTAQIDLFMRNAQYGAAIELCEAAIAINPPVMLKAGYEQLLASAYSFIDDYTEACSHGRMAIEMYEKTHILDSASDAALKLASDLSVFHTEQAWVEAEELLEKWSSKDKERADFVRAIGKLEMIAQIKILRYNNSTDGRGKQVLLDEADKVITTAEELGSRLLNRDGVRRLGNLQQLRGQLHQANGNEEGVIQSWKKALEMYARADLSFEAANCHYIIGASYLNRANRQLLPNFAEAEDHLREALAYYNKAGIRIQSADTHYMFARLYSNAAQRVNENLTAQLFHAALEHLKEGEADCDAIRREFNTGTSVLEVQQGKHALIHKSQRMYELALEVCCLLRPDPTETWLWTQRAKARSLSDILGTGTAPPARIIADIAKRPDAFQLVALEREITARLHKVAPGDRIALREELTGVWEQMKQDDIFRDYLEVRMGTAIDLDDVPFIVTGKDEDTACVCIDWVAVGDHLFLVSLRPGNSPQVVPISVRVSTVKDFIVRYLTHEAFRSNLIDTPEIFRDLDLLIAPIADLTRANELLILCPTGPLNALPLHILEIGRKPLLERNPVVYCPSLSVLRQCNARKRETSGRLTAALFGDPNGDRPEAAKLVAHLQAFFGTKPFIKDEVTLETFYKELPGKDIIHFQGHAVHMPDVPLNSYLAFADKKLTAREVFEITGLRAELVSLAACESAANVMATGDEPLGLIPAFLYAGANSVIATLWKVNQTAAAQLMQFFYSHISEEKNIFNKAEALQKAALNLRDNPRFDSPYYWAPFVLYGSWH